MLSIYDKVFQEPGLGSIGNAKKSRVVSRRVNFRDISMGGVADCRIHGCDDIPSGYPLALASLHAEANDNDTHQ